ncbi:hypothetical protein C493_08241 [Natronolimnohabitans innermongolicus JCM 12255]|uniref:Uncharacterized protein n=1 Tax=Natronolimnohabitans innermongolicus JCM 12255 TaxID=1227499 RepID=L9X6X3_9EURY|nr:hypothetical protein C493_08241 [Natronolimnohabitans innermongolicus JCM 12255]
MPRFPVRTDRSVADGSDRTRSRVDSRSALERQDVRLRNVAARVERTESRLALLENTLRGIARETGVAIGCPCDRCDRSYVLIADGMMTCPVCGYRQSL